MSPTKLTFRFVGEITLTFDDHPHTPAQGRMKCEVHEKGELEQSGEPSLPQTRANIDSLRQNVTGCKDQPLDAYFLLKSLYQDTRPSDPENSSDEPLSALRLRDVFFGRRKA